MSTEKTRDVLIEIRDQGDQLLIAPDGYQVLIEIRDQLREYSSWPELLRTERDDRRVDVKEVRDALAQVKQRGNRALAALAVAFLLALSLGGYIEWQRRHALEDSRCAIREAVNSVADEAQATKTATDQINSRLAEDLPADCPPFQTD